MKAGLSKPADNAALRPLPRTRLYEELVERLLQHIVEDGLQLGSKLPPERDLADRLGVSRATIRQAVLVLEVQGVLEVRHGDGTYLRRSTPEEPLHRLLDRRRRLPEILEAREALEVKLAELAAERRKESDIRAIYAAIDHMGSDISSGGIGVEGDAEFHHAITAAARNAVLARIMESLGPSVHETRIESLSEPGRPPKSLAAHRRIAAAIERGDPKAAVRAMRDHLQVVADVRLLHWKPEI